MLTYVTAVTRFAQCQDAARGFAKVGLSKRTNDGFPNRAPACAAVKRRFSGLQVEVASKSPFFGSQILETGNYFIRSYM